MPPRRKPFTAGQLQAICKVLADTNEGLTGSEIGHILRQVRVPEVDPTNTKWKRLFNALAKSQNRNQSGDRVLAFISQALEPARYQGDSATFEERRDQVNVTLLLYDGLEFQADGKFHKTKRASSLAEAQQRASRLRSALERRGVHPDVLHYCSAEFLGDNPFHTVLEAIAEKIRKKTGLRGMVRGSARASRAPTHFCASMPWRLNHTGASNVALTLLIGMGTFRNPTAHAPHISGGCLKKTRWICSPWPRTLTRLDAAVRYSQ